MHHHRNRKGSKAKLFTFFRQDISVVAKDKICIVSCSVLKDELLQLVKEGSLDADLVFVSKYFHIDYGQVEKNLRKVLENTLKSSRKGVVVVYGDLCLGQNGEMKQLTAEYGVVKVDATNCIDCQLGGHGAFDKADPNHNLMFMGPGMAEFFSHMKEQLQKEGMSEEDFGLMFSGIKGMVLLDTLGNSEQCQRTIEKVGFGIPILETRKIGLEGVRQVVFDAIARASSGK
jgi:hypothetical protein